METWVVCTCAVNATDATLTPQAGVNIQPNHIVPTTIVVNSAAAPSSDFWDATAQYEVIIRRRTAS